MRFRCVRGYSAIAVTALLYVLFLALAHYSFFSASRAPVPAKNINHANLSRPASGRVLVILVDSSRYTEMFSDAYMPFVSRMLRNSAWGYSKVMSFPMSIAGDHALFEGNIDSVLSIEDDFNPSPSSDENLFSRLHREGKKVFLAGDLIHLTYGKYASNTDYHRLSRNFGDYKTDAASVFHYAYQGLKSKKWDVAVVQFVAIDHLGHLETPMSPNNKPLYRKIDGYIKKLVSLTGKNDTILITAEHGMDNRGFHIDRSPLVIEPPFVLAGPHVHPSAKPYHVLQIDWAPTLSILCGVNPVYPNYAIPSLDLLNLPHQYAMRLIQAFSHHIGAETKASSFSELYRIRGEHLGVSAHTNHADVATVFIFLLFAFVLMLLLCQAGICNGIGRYFVASIGVMACDYLFVTTKSYSFMKLVPPFSANYIVYHAFYVMVYFLLCAIVGHLFKFAMSVMANDSMHCIVYAVLSLLFSVVFLSQNMYAIYAWVMMGIPALMYGFTAGIKWVYLFVTLWIGLFIRRLSYYVAHGHLHMPDQWVYALIILIFAYIICSYCKRRSNGGHDHPVIATSALVPSFIVILARPDATISAVLLLLSAVPVAIMAKRMPNVRYIVWAAWISLYCIGTSGSVDHLTRIILFPMFIFVWSYIQNATSAIRALVYLWVVWAMYMIAGNTFDIRLSELTDPYIMGAVTSSGVVYTVMLIISRYFVPIALLVGLSVDGEGQDRGVSALSMTIFPLMLGSVAVLMSLLHNSASSYPWQGEIRIIFISIAIFLVLFSFIAGRFLAYLGLWGRGLAFEDRS